MRTNGMPNKTAAFASSHRQKKTWLTVLAVLAVLVVFATVAALTMPASAMTAPATPETAATGETAAPESSALPQDNAAPSDTVTEQAEAETAALPAAAQVPEGYTVQRTVRDEENGFAVTVYAPEGVIPADATLSAMLLTESDEAYQQAGQALAEQANGGDYGFAALDIHLEDAEGNEVEPQGDVFVSIDAVGLIPEDADPESVTVQHHAEATAEAAGTAVTAEAAGTAVTVETVADAADETEGVVEVTPAEEAENNSTSTLQAPEDAPATEVQAAFTVDGFSTFTITYTVNGINYSRPVSVLLDGVEMTTEQLTTLLGSAPEIRLTRKNWTDVENLIPDNIRDSITLTVDGTQTTYYFGYAANSVGIKLHYVRIFGSEGDWLRTNRSNRPGDDQNSVDTSPDDADRRILEFPEGETLRLYYFSNYSGETPDEIVTADTSNLISINLFDYTGSDINGVINGMGNYSYGATNGETFRFTGSSEEDSAGGDNANDPYYTYWTQRDGGVVQGIVQDELGANGYPQLNRNHVTSMEALFNPGNTNNKAYTNLNHLFTYDADTNFYSFDSSLNFATINPKGYLGNSGNELDFTVYARPNDGTSDGSTGIPYFIPFNEYGTNQHINGDEEFANYHFGMTIATEFLMPRDGEIDGEDMIFSFSGDDDVWVYIDGVLILDMGGIHDSCSGTINFAEGTATVDKVYATDGTLQSNGSRTIYIGDALADAYGTTWANENLEQRTVGGEKHWFLPDYTQHDLSFFYLERGAVDSNCKIEFNLYTLQQNSIYVGKQLTGAEGTTEGISNYLSNIEYQFRILDADAETETLFIKEGTTYDLRSIETSEVVGSGTVGADGIFTVKAGQYAVFTGIDEDSGHYYVQELMDENYSAQFGEVEVSVKPDGGSTGFSEDDGFEVGDIQFDGVISGNLDAGNGTGSVVFTNKVDIDKVSTLSIEKNVLPGSEFNNDSFTVNVTMGDTLVPEGTTYQLYSSNGSVTSAIVSEDGVITLEAGQRAVFTVLTGTEFTIYETGGAGYHADYEATQQFNGETSHPYNLTNDGMDGANGITVSGTVGDIRGTNFGSDTPPDDGTNASMAVTLTNSSFDFSTSFTISKTLEGWTSGDESTFTFNVVETDQNGNQKNPVTTGITVVSPITITISDSGTNTGTGYINFGSDYVYDSNNTDSNKYYFKVSENGADPIAGITYDTDYYLVEVTVNEENNEQSASVTGVTKHNANGSLETFNWTSGAALPFTNALGTDVTIKKVDASNHNTTLEGATFRLYYTDNNGTKQYYQATVNAGQTTVKWTSSESDATLLTSTSNGIVVFQDLRIDRTYYLIETAAPNGYQMLAYPIQISWDTDGDLMASYAAGGATTGGVTVDGNTIIVPNSTGAELPETGGVGTTFLTCGGLLLMAAAVGGYALRRRRGKGAR